MDDLINNIKINPNAELKSTSDSKRPDKNKELNNKTTKIKEKKVVIILIKFTYLGIKLEDDKNEDKILQMIKHAVASMIEVYNDKELNKFLLDLDKEGFGKTSKWKYPNHWHVTTLFVGGNKTLKNDPILLNFKENDLVSIDFEGFILVPNKIATGICFPKAEVKNKIPHVTIMTNEWKPKESNTVCEALFCDGQFKKEYETVFKNSDYKEKFIECVNVSIGKENVNVYIIKLNPSFHFDGFTRYFQ